MHIYINMCVYCLTLFFMRIIRPLKVFTRSYRVLAIESSCDDSAVALVNRPPNSPPYLEDHIKATLDSAKDGGIIPIEALSHHLQHIAPVVDKLLTQNGRPQIDLICATQGPGMFSSLSAGLQVAKGLSIAWNVPLVPVHHMLAHLLTPRFFTNAQDPQFPFLSLLVSGGHTMLVLSRSLFDHEILVDTIDNPIGNSLDKCGRYLGLKGTMIGKELDSFVGDWNSVDFNTLPTDLSIPLPLEREKKGTLGFSFAHFASLMPRFEKKYDWQPLSEQPVELRRALAAAMEDTMFSHLVKKIKLAVETCNIPTPIPLMCAGGVAANSRLRSRLHTDLASLGLVPSFPDLKWCTDNALMIAWAGIETYEANKHIGGVDSLTAVPKAKWPLSEYTEKSCT